MTMYTVHVLCYFMKSGNHFFMKTDKPYFSFRNSFEHSSITCFGGHGLSQLLWARGTVHSEPLQANNSQIMSIITVNQQQDITFIYNPNYVGDNNKLQRDRFDPKALSVCHTSSSQGLSMSITMAKVGAPL